MPTTITINGVTGSSPYDVYLCDDPITTCIYIETIISTSLPYSFDVPNIMESQSNFNVKIVDNNDCSVIENLSI
jgi:hypothetical protein